MLIMPEKLDQDITKRQNKLCNGEVWTHLRISPFFFVLLRR